MTKKTMHLKNPIFIIIMRNDIGSLNAGKACAQASHAANAMVDTVSKSDPVFREALGRWQRETKQGFGTCIVLEGSWQEIYDFVATKTYNQPYICQSIVDPTYPVRDGIVTHLIELPTCVWAFGDKDDMNEIRNSFDLML